MIHSKPSDSAFRAGPQNKQFCLAAASCFLVRCFVASFFSLCALCDESLNFLLRCIFVSFIFSSCEAFVELDVSLGLAGFNPALKGLEWVTVFF